MGHATKKSHLCLKEVRFQIYFLLSSKTATVDKVGIIKICEQDMTWSYFIIFWG